MGRDSQNRGWAESMCHAHAQREHESARKNMPTALRFVGMALDRFGHYASCEARFQPSAFVYGTKSAHYI
jgi:hypothetical protein